MIVDHSNPIHDGFCRCIACKPSPVGARSQSLMRMRVGALGLIAVTVLAARIGGLA